MGKIRRERKKLHLRAKQTQNLSDSAAKKTTSLPLPCDVHLPTEGLFSKVDTQDLSFLTQQLPQQQKQEDDRMTYISKKSISGEGRLKKKDKRKMRHEQWLQKIDTIKQAKKSKKAAHQRAQAPIVGDLHPLTQALPELAQVLRLGDMKKTQQTQTRCNQKNKPKKSTMKSRERKKMLLDEQAKFQQVLSHSVFKSNPLATINEHLRNKMKKEQEECMEEDT